MVEDDRRAAHKKLCLKCCNLRQAERKEPAKKRQRKILVADRNSRGKLSACLGQEDACEKLTGGRGLTTEIGKQLDRRVAVQRRIGSAAGKRQPAAARPNGSESESGRLVGVVED